MLQALERAVGGEDVGEIAERILVGGEPRSPSTTSMRQRTTYWPSWLRGVSRSTWITPVAGGS